MSMNSGQKRIWNADSDEERRAVTNFLRLCSSVFSVNELDEMNQEDMQRVVREILNNEMSIEDLRSMSPNELYDHIIGQGRLF